MVEIACAVKLQPEFQKKKINPILVCFIYRFDFEMWGFALELD